MDRTERLLNLLSALLGAEVPLPFAQIRELLPGAYSDYRAAAERMFERDKEDLLELGVNVQWSGDFDENDGGYAIDRRAHYLPNIAFAEDELATLAMGAAACLAQPGFPYAREVAQAIAKLSVDRNVRAPDRFLVHAPVEHASALHSEHLSQIRDALAAKKRVHLHYRSPFGGPDATTERDVDPYGLYYRRGVWVLVGHCHVRKALRSFHVARIRGLEVNRKKPRTPDFTIPPSFDLRVEYSREPWSYAVHPPIEARIRFVPPAIAQADWLVADQGARAIERTEHSATVDLTVTNQDGLIAWLLGFRQAVELIAPVELRERVRSLVAAIRDRARA